MKKAIIVAVIILAAVTAAGIVSLKYLSGKEDSESGSKTPATKDAGVEKLLEEDTEKRTSDEVLESIRSIGPSPSAETGGREKYEVSRERYEECGHETDRWLIRYSDGSYDIVDMD